MRVTPNRDGVAGAGFSGQATVPQRTSIRGKAVARCRRRTSSVREMDRRGEIEN